MALDALGALGSYLLDIVTVGDEKRIDEEGAHAYLYGASQVVDGTHTSELGVHLRRLASPITALPEAFDNGTPYSQELYCARLEATGAMDALRIINGEQPDIVTGPQQAAYAEGYGFGHNLRPLDELGEGAPLIDYFRSQDTARAAIAGMLAGADEEPVE